MSASSTEISLSPEDIPGAVRAEHTRNIQQLPCIGGCSAEEKQSAFLE